MIFLINRSNFFGKWLQRIINAAGCQGNSLQPGSIYHAFGNKEGLFSEALERYAQKSLAHIRDVMDRAPSIGEGLCSILEEKIEDSDKEPYNSCFLIKTRLELAAEGGELHQLASSKLDEIEALLRSYLEREFDKKQSQQRAVSLMLHIFGLRIYGYQSGSAERMRQGLQEGLPWLPWEQSALKLLSGKIENAR